MILPDEKTCLDRKNIERIINDSTPGGLKGKISAKNFIKAAIDGAETFSEIDPDSFIFSLWMLAAINENIITARSIILQRTVLENSLNGHEDEDIADYANKIGISVRYSDEIFKVPMPDFLKYTARVSGNRYRLAYQAIDAGVVLCRKEVFIKIVREAFVQSAFKIIDSLDPDIAGQILLPYIQEITDLKDHYKRRSREADVSSVIDAKYFPPCVKAFITQLRDGTNLPHMARLTLASFMHKVGAGDEDIAKLFVNAPDYDENITMYQVRHISGEISGIEYSPPKCDTLRSNHLCYMDDDRLCNQEWMKHPLTYYEIKRKRK
ncbi:MAG: DNA primase regulatory subunit PriL [Thermoplasmata archaeon]